MEEVVSSFFSSGTSGQVSSIDDDKNDLSDDFLTLIDELNLCLEQYKMPSKVEAVYNPTIYARCTFEMYVKKYCNTPKPVMYFGMNPGPFGMSQTGIPFGEVNSVRDWLDIEGPVGTPQQEIPARPVTGFNCSRSEISGKRFWGLFKSLCKTPDKFFQTSFVYNYLPQQWMTKKGLNLTPSDFKASEVEDLYKICDPIFNKVLDLYQVEKIVAIGKFCETRAKKTLEKYPQSRQIQILYMPHPSPRAVNNTDWNKKAEDHLRNYDILQYYQN